MRPDGAKLQSRVDECLTFYEREGHLPSFAEMADLFGLRSKNAVSKVVYQFEKLGIVTRDSKGRIVPGEAARAIKKVGTVEAGFPGPVESELYENVSFDRLLVHNRQTTYMIVVTGDSMIEAGILPKDIVIVDTSLKPRPNDIIIACVDGKWTMKYFCRDEQGVYLAPANAKYPVLRPQEQLIIHSVVTSSIRKYR